MQERPLVATLAIKVSHRRKNEKSPGFRSLTSKSVGSSTRAEIGSCDSSDTARSRDDVSNRPARQSEGSTNAAQVPLGSQRESDLKGIGGQFKQRSSKVVLN
jgi:hypothetical protein